MPTDPHLDPEEDALAQMGYELEDVEFRSLGKSIAWFFGFVAFCGVAGVIVFFMFLGGPSPVGAWNAAMSAPGDTSPFVKHVPAQPNPLIQTNVTARTDIRDLRQGENAELYSVGWVDKNKGVVHIPIDQAIDIYLKRMGQDPNQKATMATGAPPVEPPHQPEGGEEK